MRYNAEIFDKFQYLYKKTGFCDRHIRCIINFNGSVEPSVLKRAAELLLTAVPILSRRYVDLGGRSYWEDEGVQDLDELFTVTDNKAAFDRFACSMTDSEIGPQIKFCLLCAKNDSLAVVINHMVCDGAGMKQCLYLYALIYSNLMKDPNYLPEFVIDGDRSFRSIAGSVSFPRRLVSLISGSKDSNQESPCGFLMGSSEKVAAFLLSHEIPTEMYRDIREYCHSSGVTVNDVILTAYLRALSKMLEMQGQEISVPIMIDMRRYVADKSFSALTNLASTSIVKLHIAEEEDFESTLRQINAIMEEKKHNGLGLNTFFKLYDGFRLPLVDAYAIMEKVLKNPKISMTNIGVIDASKLVFVNSKVRNAVIYSSIKYRPYFQISVSSFNDTMTFAAGLYGDEEDKANIRRLFRFIDNELLALDTYIHTAALRHT